MTYFIVTVVARQYLQTHRYDQVTEYKYTEDMFRFNFKCNLIQ